MESPSVNFIVVLLNSLIPLFIGFVWYNPKVFGSAWMKAADMTEDKMKGAKMWLIFGLTLVMGFFISGGLLSVVIHQYGVFQALQHHITDPEAIEFNKSFMTKFGTEFRTFGHGALHGGIACMVTIVPALVVNALFERKSFKYIAINGGFWLVCLILMGGVICQFA